MSSGSLVDRIAEVVEDHTWGTGHSSPDECWCGESFGNPAAHAAHVAEQIAALFTEEVRELPDGMGGISTNMKTGETTHHFRPCTRQRRWVSAWTDCLGALEVS